MCVFKEVRIGIHDISFKGAVINELLIMVKSFSLITRLGEVILLQSHKRKGSRTCLEQGPRRTGDFREPAGHRETLTIASFLPMEEGAHGCAMKASYYLCKCY